MFLSLWNRRERKFVACAPLLAGWIALSGLGSAAFAQVPFRTSSPQSTSSGAFPTRADIEESPIPAAAYSRIPFRTGLLENGRAYSPPRERLAFASNPNAPIPAAAYDPELAYYAGTRPPEVDAGTRPLEAPVYDRYERYFAPVDRAFGARGTDRFLYDDTAFAADRHSTNVDMTLGIGLTSGFDPSQATFKLGPLYLDLLALSASLLYTNYDGRLAPGIENSGFTGIISLTGRALLQITPSAYFSMVGTLYYLPFTNKVGFDLGGGFGPGFRARVASEHEYKGWNLLFYDQFTVQHVLYDVFDDVGVGEIDAVGRYRFGRLDADPAGTNRNEFDSDRLVYTNVVGAVASTRWGEPWRLTLSASHRDLWFAGFEERTDQDIFAARLAYQSDALRFTPYVEYRFTANDTFRIQRHEITVGASAALSPNLFAHARLGYGWLDDTESDSERHPYFLGEIGLTHILGPYTRHSLNFGSRFQDTDLGNSYYATYLRYTLNQLLSARVNMGLYMQAARLERVGGFGQDHDEFTIGSTLRVRLTPRTSFSFLAAYDAITAGSDGPGDRELVTLRALISQRLGPTLYASLIHQYRQQTSDRSFDDYTEHLLLMTLTKAL
jgi:hypothetical protein